MENVRTHKDIKLETTKKVESICHQNQVIKLQIVSQKMKNGNGYIIDKNSNTYE